jgi:hypothetical protein
MDPLFFPTTLDDATTPGVAAFVTLILSQLGKKAITQSVA